MPEDGLDIEVRGVMDLLNRLEGVETFSSCSGHGTNLCYMAFKCSNFNSLQRIIRAVNSIRWDCGNDFDRRIHLWTIHLIPSKEGEILWSIDWQEISEKRGEKINTKEAWQVLGASLKGE